MTNTSKADKMILILHNDRTQQQNTQKLASCICPSCE